MLATATGPVLLDWDLLCRGPAAWDHGPLMSWTERWGGEPGIYERFAEGYGASLRGDPLGEAVEELRLVAATLMRVRAGRRRSARRGGGRAAPQVVARRPRRPAVAGPVAVLDRLADGAEVAGTAGELGGLDGGAAAQAVSRWYTYVVSPRRVTARGAGEVLVGGRW